MFLYSVGPSRIDQVIQCDLLHVTARTDTQKKIRVISFLPSDMPSGGGGGGGGGGGCSDIFIHT